MRALRDPFYDVLVLAKENFLMAKTAKKVLF